MGIDMVELMTVGSRCKQDSPLVKRLRDQGLLSELSSPLDRD
jgi:hypothetical protein